jgi:dTDP-4-amino-4,6-dideoxygalactose transaminase
VSFLTWKIPLSDLDLGEEEIDAVTSVLRSKWLSMGPVTQQFEAAFAQYIGVKYAFAVNSGTAALHIACQVLGLGPGDEVILPSLTFVATANTVLYVGAIPVFADITSLADFNISPDDILKKITSRTKAITVVHFAGYPCQMDRIMEIARAHNLKVIEDAAHAPGAVHKGKKIGAIGDVGCFSFFSNKNMTTGEGGMIVTNDEALAGRIKLIRSHGMTALTWHRHRGHAYSYDVVETGYNYRISEITSALGLVQLKKLEQNNDKRRRLTELYREHLKDTPWFSLPFLQSEGKPSYHVFPVLLAENINREKFIDKLKSKGIQSSIYYPPVHLFSKYRQMFGFKEGMLSKTEYVGKHEITLPLQPLLKEEDVSYIAGIINQFPEEVRG